MKHEPRQAIHTEKQLASAHKLDGAESLGICKAGQTVLARLMETQIWHKLADSVGGGFRKEIMASACHDAKQFIFSLYATCYCQATTLVLELRGSESV